MDSATEFSNLPENCVAQVISFTNPLEACRFTTVSTVFHSAADADAVWERFFPSDHQAIIAQSDADTQKQLLGAHLSKQLFMRLAHSPILIEGGRKSFFLDKASGKKCFMIAAREIAIVWGDGNTPQYWEWISLPDSRFAEVAQLLKVCWLELSGGIEASLLSPKTTYASYLVFKFSTESDGFEGNPVETSVGMATGVKNKKTIFLAHRVPRFFLGHRVPRLSSSRRGGNGQYPKRRSDGWMEAKLGECFVEGGAEDGDELVEVRLEEVKRGNWKRGLVVQGIEFRPKA